MGHTSMEALVSNWVIQVVKGVNVYGESQMRIIGKLLLLVKATVILTFFLDFLSL